MCLISLKPLWGGGFKGLNFEKNEIQNASSLFRYERYQHKTAFTLAEVLITLVVIGVIAAVTIPVVVPMIQERVDSHRHSNIVHKITQATDAMKSLGVLGRFNSTDDFVDELEKHLKIIKRCDSNNLSDCWPTEKVKGSDGKEYFVKDKKTRGDLGFLNDRNNPNVGIILNDGTSIIMTYNSDNDGLDQTEALVASGKELPVGTNTKEFLEFTTNSTAGLAFVVDVNGAKKPNSETINGRFHDIRNLNGANFAGCGGMIIDSTCYTPIDSYSSLDCSRTNDNLNKSENAQYCGNISHYSNDYWAGAIKTCANINAELPDLNILKNDICKNKKDKLSISEGTFWSSSSNDYDYAYPVHFSSCSTNYGDKSNTYKIICVGN